MERDKERERQREREQERGRERVRESLDVGEACYLYAHSFEPCSAWSVEPANESM